MKAWAYWVGAIALILFGWIAIFSVGAPFLLLGLMLAVLFPWRGRRGVVATGAAVVLGFVVGYVLVAPLSCSGTSIATVGGSLSRGTVSCSNVLGIDYEGTGNYHPSLLPALLAGIALASVAGATTAWLSRRHRPHRGVGVPPEDHLPTARSPR
jgi:hypothetical protein